MLIKVKKEYRGTVVGFNNSSLPLGERHDLHLLLDDCIGPNNEIRSSFILSMFEKIPTKAQIQRIKNKAFLDRLKKIK